MRAVHGVSIALAACAALHTRAALADGSESSPAPASVTASTLLDQVHLVPFVTVVGGVKVDTVLQPSSEQKQGRISTIALSAFGLHGAVGDWATIESELMANGGTDLHGSSAWEGQAALQVRQQLVRIARSGWTFEGGRILDDASLNFMSAHVGDALYQDTATRDPLLYSGLNLGNGIRVAYEPVEGLHIGLVFTAGNPVSTSASLQIGGSFPPFDRFYIQPYQQVKQSPNNYPDDTFHMMLLAPNLTYVSRIFDLKVEAQGYTVDTNTNSANVSPLRGYTLRATSRLKLLDDALMPFASLSVDRNDTVLATDASQLAVDKYTGVTFGGGVDVNWAKPFPNRYNGVGVQYDLVQYQVGSGTVTSLHYFNIGATYWVHPSIAIGARIALWMQHVPGSDDEGELSGLLTARAVL